MTTSLESEIPGLPAIYWRPYDTADDALFYAEPRLVAHIDDAAIAAIGRFYAERLRPGGVYLDLMSSYLSHLPEGLQVELVGLGMNAEELRQNRQLTRWLVHNLNANPTLPFESETFDGVMIVVSVQYLRRPVAVFREILRVLKPGGAVYVIFSNRLFPTKAVAIWQMTTDEQHFDLITLYVQHAGTWERVEWLDLSPNPGVSDPVYCVAAHRPIDPRPENPT
ncbi:MAG: class I SAM-dependent methyltransferase [Dehalococcoidia bacterium]|nr:class I SAM-dependent methyltransferase [Dehalococcoidia bacterium]